MGTCREKRESEKTFDQVWNEMRSLTICVWYGKHLLDSVQEHVDLIKQNMDRVVEQMKEECNE